MMTKLIVVFATAEVGAKPKEIIDKVTNNLNAAQALAAEKQKEIENVDTPAGESK
jgi:hypothetical protein